MCLEIHPAGPKDLPFLEEMLFEAFFWDRKQPRPSFVEFKKNPEFSKLLHGWGKTGDYGVIAEESGTPTGAAWYRYWTDKHHSYGYLDPDTPEIGLGVKQSHRGKGTGRILLQSLLSHARLQGIPRISLSVDPANFALLLYESEGFIKVGESGTSWTLCLDLEA